MNWLSATSTVVACCGLFNVASNGQVYSKCAVQRTVNNVLAFCDLSNDQRADTAKNTNMNWNSP